MVYISLGFWIFSLWVCDDLCRACRVLYFFVCASYDRLWQVAFYFTDCACRLSHLSHTLRHFFFFLARIIENPQGRYVAREGAWVPESKHSPLEPSPNEMTLCTRVYGEPHFESRYALSPPPTPLPPPHLKQSGYAPGTTAQYVYCHVYCILMLNSFDTG